MRSHLERSGSVLGVALGIEPQRGEAVPEEEVGLGEVGGKPQDGKSEDHGGKGKTAATWSHGNQSSWEVGGGQGRGRGRGRLGASSIASSLPRPDFRLNEEPELSGGATA